MKIKNESEITLFFKTLSENDQPKSWLRFLCDEGLLNPDKPPRSSSWKEIYLKNVSKANLENPDEETSKLLQNIIEKHCQYIEKLKSQKRDCFTNRILLGLIGNLPKENITENIINNVSLLLKNYYGADHVASLFSEYVFKKIVKTENKEFIISSFRAAIGYEITKKYRHRAEEVYPIIGEYYFKKFIHNNIENVIPTYCISDCLLCFIELIKKIHSDDKDAFILLSLIESSNSDLSFSTDYELQILIATKKLADLLIEKEKIEEIKEIMKALQGTEISVLRGIKIYLGIFLFKKMESFVWERVVDDKVLNYANRQESCRFFREHKFRFNSIQIKRITFLIEKIRVKNIIDKKKREEKEARLKRGWLCIFLEDKSGMVNDKNLMGGAYEEMLNLYNEYEKITQKVQSLEHPARQIKTGHGGGSPFCIEKLKELSVEDFAKKVSGYKEPLRTDPDDPSKRGLAYDLTKIIAENPKKYVAVFRALLSWDPYYLYSVMTGLYRAQQKAITFPWNILLSEMLDYLKRRNWNWNNDDRYSYEEEFLKEFFCLLKGEVVSQKGFFSSSDMSLIKDIIICSWNNISSSEKNCDDIDRLIFSLFGELFNLTIEYLIVTKKIENKNLEFTWENNFRDMFSDKLSEASRDSSFSVNLGRHLKSLIYLDKDWVLNNFDNIFPIENNPKWKDAMSGFLFNWHIWDEDKMIYDKMKVGRHLERAISNKFSSYEANSGIVKYICSFYFSDYDNETIFQLVKSKDNDRIYRVIRLCKEEERPKDKIRKIWLAIFNEYKKDATNSESKKIIVELNGLQKYFDSLSENEEQLMHSFGCLETHSDSVSLKILEKFVDREHTLVAKLMVKTVQNNFFFYYYQERVRSILEKLENNGEKNKAKKIRKAYADKYLFL